VGDQAEVDFGRVQPPIAAFPMVATLLLGREIRQMGAPGTVGVALVPPEVGDVVEEGIGCDIV